MKKVVLVDRDRWLVMLALEQQVDEAYAPYCDGIVHAYCKCGNFIDPKLTRGKKCMSCVFHRRRVVVSILLGLLVGAVALMGGHLIHG